MANESGPDETGKTGPGKSGERAFRDDDLERRRRQLAETLAARRQGEGEGGRGAKSGETTGYGQAVKLSSEFIAGVAVGAGLGWAIDRLAGTSPWGLIVFLLLGFGAGVLNVMRSAGVVAQVDPKASDKNAGDRDN
ncbi:AtpZ/AtpI family protein [Pseudaminobacter salicylatoxidans]|uniref:AtpZ/AtpI family protein n=1 Tax=Pseudaminobacter salicylatoxidans TaxID=93369 RepID=UPI0002E83E30|nr:AtpZ/AtpI family protein [Pseudaminobacter salicylatoxidans]